MNFHEFMWPPCLYKPVYSHLFQPGDGGVKLVQPPFAGPVCYSWTPVDVGNWLMSCGFGRYRRIFEHRAIDGKCLLHYSTPATLVQIGIRCKDDALRISACINSLKTCYRHIQPYEMPGVPPYNHYRAIYFGERPLYLRLDKPPRDC